MGSIRKSPRNPSRWEARYRDVAGHQRTKTLPSRADAKAWLAATETDIRRGSWIDLTMAATRIDVLATHWLKATHAKRASSIARDQSILKTHILPVLGSRGVGSVTRAEVQQLVNDWIAHAAASTVVRQYACMRALFSYAEECELIPRSPCRNIRVPEAHPRDSLILDDAQIAKLGDALGRYRPMLYLALLGLRWGEIAGLRVGDVDFLRGSLTVTRQRTRGEKGRMVEHDPKTRAGRRSLSLPVWMTEMRLFCRFRGCSEVLICGARRCPPTFLAVLRLETERWKRRAVREVMAEAARCRADRGGRGGFRREGGGGGGQCPAAKGSDAALWSLRSALRVGGPG